jgi:hypothetical protein
MAWEYGILAFLISRFLYRDSLITIVPIIATPLTLTIKYIMNTKEQLQQVYLKPCEGATYPTIPQEIHEDARRETAKHYHSLLEELICSSSYSLVSTYNFPPYPLLVSQDQVLHLGKFNDALTHAIDSIVERWWTDREAAFPQRMPLGSVEEDLLRVSVLLILLRGNRLMNVAQWVQKASEEKLVRGFDIRKGVWHPDFLLGSSNQLKSNGYMVCEINARLPFELLPITMYAHKAILSELYTPYRG